MGLDMYLRAKTNKRPRTEPTGACSGLFGVAPAQPEGFTEIGYWRKAYDQQDAILSVAEPHTEFGYRLKEEAIDEILNIAREKLATANFDEDGCDPDSDIWTFNSKHKWEITIDFMTEAKAILKDDPEAEIYYLEWF